MNTLVVGLAGYARSGKDTAALALIEDGFERRAFADKLRDFLYRLNPSISGSLWSLAEIVDAVGWEQAKAETPEIRALLQRCGTDAGRKVLGENVWVDATMRDLPALTVITDVRFPNEVAAIRERGGVVLRIVREGVGAFRQESGETHESETALDSTRFDATIHNNGTMADLYREVRWNKKLLFHFPDTTLAAPNVLL